MKSLWEKYFATGHLDFEAAKFEKWCIIAGVFVGLSPLFIGTYILKHLNLPFLVDSILTIYLIFFSFFIGFLIYGMMWEGLVLIGRNYWKGIFLLTPLFFGVFNHGYFYKLSWFYKIPFLILSLPYAGAIFHFLRKFENSGRKRYLERLERAD
jgi:hypothetical protein